MSKDSERGLGESILYQHGASNVYWAPRLNSNEQISDEAAWLIDYNPLTGNYYFKNAASGNYLSHTDTAVNLKNTSKPGAAEQFQLMPDRTDVTIKTSAADVTTHGYWFCWGNGSSNKSMIANAFSNTLGYGKVVGGSFDFSDNATKQQWIIISEDELSLYNATPVASSISNVEVTDYSTTQSNTINAVYNTNGTRLSGTKKGLNIIRYNDGTTKKLFVK